MVGYSLNKNPFQITTPEDLSAKEACDLFVNEFTDFSKIIDSGHMFLSGPRGTGKSMMFRYLQADCQCIAKDCSFSELPFVGVYIPIKNWSLIKTELKRLDDKHASETFNEHLMVTHIFLEVLDSFLKNNNVEESIDKKELESYFNDIFCLVLDYYDSKRIQATDFNSTRDILKKMQSIIRHSYTTASSYTKKLAFVQNDFPQYEGALYDYQDFLVPLLSSLKDINGFPDGPIYLLIDDAHFLSDIQTRILNSWIATRTSRKISIKVSTQYDYKNYYTVTGSTINSPHDYSEVDLSTVYTSNMNANYRKRIEKIVNRRLILSSINVTAVDFFPVNEEQERAIKEIHEEYIRKFEKGLGNGNKKTDDAYRYSRPDYIKNLAGSRKASSTYSYSGFEQLVNLSSGVIRYFLESAHKMYSKALSDSGSKDKKIEYIPHSIQSQIIRQEAENFLFLELEKYQKEGHADAVPKEDIQYLSNLVQGLGGLFRQILLSNRSERRVFSIAVSDDLSDFSKKILDIGINLGFFHRSTIGRKESVTSGRTRLYVMNRRLAPIWNLDPNGFAGYLFIKNDILEQGMKEPWKFLKRIEKDIDTNSDFEYRQLSLFDQEELIFSDDMTLT